MIGNDIKQFVPQEICLSCEGCCRFSEPEGIWRPKVFSEEVSNEALVKALDEQNHFCLTKSDSGWQCPFFKEKDNTCTVYSSRPFECLLYPFLLVKKDEKVFVGAHLNCPYVHGNRGTDSYTQTVEHLKEYFQKPEMKSLLSKNKHMASDYKDSLDEIEVLFEVEGSETS